MQKRIQETLIIVLIALVWLTGGCAPSVQDPVAEPTVSEQEVRSVLDRARENFELLRTLSMNDRYTDEYQEAAQTLQEAETLLESNLRDDAFTSAQKSLEASQNVLKQFYQESIVASAQGTKTKIEDILAEDPDSALQDFIPKLNDILDYSEEIERGQQMVDLEKLLEDIEKVEQIEHDTETHISQTLESDISFGPGKYVLSPEGKQALEESHTEFITTIKEYKTQYPEKLLLIKIKVVGHTDSTGFKSGTRLVEELSEGIEDLPVQYPERGQVLNQRLSEFRARTISEHLEQFIREEIGDASRIEIEQEIIGLGEEIPKGLPGPYGYQDPRRRICKIYTYITAR